MSNTLRAVLSLLGLCALIILLSAAGLASDFITRLLAEGIDGLLMLMVCLLMGGLFTLMLLVVAKESGLLPSHSKQATETVATAKPGAGK